MVRSSIVDAGSFSVNIPAERVATYMPYVGKDVIFGIRPDDIHNPLFVPPGIVEQPVEAKVDVTELMGNEIIVYLTSGDHSFVARVDPRTRWHMGDPITVKFNMENVHIFDKDTEKAIR